MPTFPSSPSIGDYFNTTSGRFKWDGEKWIYERPLPAFGLTGPTGDTGPQGSVPSGTAPGIVHAYVGTTAPSGWLFCDGSTITSSSYPQLFNALTANGTQFPYGGSGTGGTISSAGTKRIHSFSSNGTFSTTTSLTITVEVVGGGGAGGAGYYDGVVTYGGGGGAGAVPTIQTLTIGPGSYSIVVGQGGTTTGGDGNSGGTSSFDAGVGGVISGTGGGGGLAGTSGGGGAGGSNGTYTGGSGDAAGGGGAGAGGNGSSAVGTTKGAGGNYVNATFIYGGGGPGGDAGGFIPFDNGFGGGGSGGWGLSESPQSGATGRVVVYYTANSTNLPDLRGNFIRGRSGNNISSGSSNANTGAGGAHNHTTVYNANAGNTSGSGDHATYVNVIYGHNHGGNTGGPSANDSSRWGNTNVYQALPSNGHSHGTYTYHSTEGNANNSGNHTHYHNAAGVSNATHGDESSHTHAVNDPGSVTFAYIIKT